MKKTANLLIKSLSFIMAVTLFAGVSVTIPNVTASAAVSNYVSVYRSGAADKTDALSRAKEVNLEVEEEGVVLLKNEKNALPLTVGNKISVFGKNSVKPIYFPGGYAAGADAPLPDYDYTTFLESLENAGFVVNPDLVAFYNNNNLSDRGRDGGSGTGQVATRTGETPVASYSAALKASFSSYNDAAIIFITRDGGEGGDLRTFYNSGTAGRSNIRQNNDPTTGDHYLELDDNEKDMIAMVKENFSKVIVLLNSGNPIELSDLKEDERIDSIMWIGYPGTNGFSSVGRILNGEVSPSGRLADIYAKDFKKDPTFFNFGLNYDNTYLDSNSVRFVEYDEGIYVGYRYYETRGFTEDDDCEWYNDNVVYPFGYGLSYTAFSKTVNFVTGELTADGDVVADVTVTNTGDYAGKEVIEMYYSAPYYDGQIEKSHVNLGAFEKTDLLQPGKSQTVRVSMKVRSMASYDHNDANANDFKGYELDKGEYTIYIGENSHCWADKDVSFKKYDLAKGITYDKDEKTGAEIENRFDYVSVYFDEKDDSKVWSGHSKIMSRTDFESTFPRFPSESERTITQAEADTYAPFNSSVTSEYDEGKPWYVDQMPKMNTNRGSVKATELVGLDYDDPKWEAFMDQLTFNEMAGLVMHGFFQTDAIRDLDVPLAIISEGSFGFMRGSSIRAIQGTCIYASPIVVSSTWNKKLAKKMGEAVGDESIWGGDFSGGNAGGYNGWQAPGGNIHRSPFSGRYAERYSEDPVLAGDVCANVVEGARSKGLFVMVKYFALNEQETTRGNLATWANEQTMREIYLKAFESAVKDGGATGIMSGFNRIGYAWTGFSYSLLIEVLRNEWGFDGLVSTDWVNGFMKPDHMVRAGCDLWFANGNVSSLNGADQQTDPTHVSAVRRAAHSVLYTSVNSNAMNRLGARYRAEHGNYNQLLGIVQKGGTVSYDAASTVFTGYKYVLNNAPKGITIDEDTGAISGTVASDAVAGTYDMVVSLKDEKGFIGQAINLLLTVSGGGLTYVGENDVKVVLGKFARIDARSAINGKTVSYSLADGSTLPAGMALTGDGYIVGKPTAAGEYVAKVVASADGESALTTQVKFTAAEEAEIVYAGETLTAGKVGESYSADLKKATGADEIAYAAADLPAGLTFEDGVLSGTPTQTGTFTISVTASADGAKSATAEFTLVIAEADPEIPDESATPSDDSSVEPAGSAAPTESIKPEPEKKGCGGMIGLGGALGVLAILGASVFIFRKKDQ